MDARADRFPLFDSLRAIAALGVLGAHANFYSKTGLGAEGFGAGFLPQLGARLDVGVAVFFLISGFLLYRPFAKARLRGGERPRAAAYAWRRFLRIVPAYWVALALVALWIGETTRVYDSVGDALVFFGFGQIYSAQHLFGGIAQAWTLDVEVAFYAFLPLWAAGMAAVRARAPHDRLRVELIGLALLALAGVAWKVWAVRSVGTSGFTSQPLLMPLPNFLDHFAIGMGLAVLSVWYEGRTGAALPRLLRVVDRHPGVPWLVAAAAFVVVSKGIGLNGGFQELTGFQWMARHSLYAVVAAGLVLPAIFGDPRRGLVRRLLANRVMLYLGLVSYGIFLWHVAVLTQLERWGLGTPTGTPLFDYAIWFVLGALGATAIATASYYLVERPALSLKRLVRGRPVDAGEATAEPAPPAPAAVR